MVGVIFKTDADVFKKGEQVNLKPEEAEMFVEEGVAEYVDKPKTKKQLEIIRDSLNSRGENAIIKGNEIHLISKGVKKEDELIALLKKPNIFNLITEKEMDKKIVKEIETRKVIFLCAQGRLVENCQTASYNLLVNDDAGTGKDYVTEKTLEILPKNDYIKKTRISPTVFTYWHNSEYEPDWTWDGKVFYTEDISENVLNSEVFKVMCSSGSSATIVIKQRAYDIDIRGKPVMITTTATSIPSPELTRRFEFLNLDESINQTQEIMKRHSEYAKKGIHPEYDPKYAEAMAFLQRVKVKIPYADKLHSLFPADSIVMRTKYPRFLDLIKASCAFHQFQRKKDNEGYYVASGKDYDVAKSAIEKLTTNKYMISLTRNQRKIVEFFEKNPYFCENLAKINEKMANFISLPALKTNVGILTKYNILEINLETDNLNREIDKFRLSKDMRILGSKGLKLPNFKELISRDSKVSKVNIDSKEEIVSKVILQNSKNKEIKLE